MLWIMIMPKSVNWWYFVSDYLYFYFCMMIKFSYYLQIFLQVIFAQIIFGSDIFQLRYNDLQSLLVNSRSNRNFQTLEDVLARDGAFVSNHSHDCCSLWPATQWVSRTLLRSAMTRPLRWKLDPLRPFWTHWTVVETRPKMRNLFPAKKNFLHWMSVSFNPRLLTRS